MERILIVDDELNVLSGLQRQLRRAFEVESALGGAAAMEVVEDRGPFAVVVSDMRMPGVDGLEFLGWIREHNPDTVRMILTGHADLESAIRAVNDGHIFRFLTKPCPSETMVQAVREGIRQYQLVLAERDLLERTLKESVRVLVEILSLVNPEAFSHTSRVSRLVGAVVQDLAPVDPWEFEVSALLSQVGCLALPTQTVSRGYAGQPMDPREQTLFREHPGVAAGLLEKIPRMELVAEIIRGQTEDFSAMPAATELSDREKRRLLGSQLLRIAIDSDLLLAGGLSFSAAVEKLAKKPGTYNPKLLDRFRSLEIDESTNVVKNLSIRELAPGMTLDQDLSAQNGVLLATRGRTISGALLARLRGFAETVGVDQPIRVLIKVAERSERLSSL
ncbi:MAG: response regulator [Acidobacteriota bacterium]